MPIPMIGSVPDVFGSNGKNIAALVYAQGSIRAGSDESQIRPSSTCWPGDYRWCM